MKKFNTNKEEEKEKKKDPKNQSKQQPTSSFFTQQMHVQPPQGYNSSVAAPLAPGGGWAPSIPFTN